MHVYIYIYMNLCIHIYIYTHTYIGMYEGAGPSAPWATRDPAPRKGAPYSASGASHSRA